MASSILRVAMLLFVALFFFSSTLAQEQEQEQPSPATATPTSTYLPVPVQINSTNIWTTWEESESDTGLRIVDDDPVYRYIGCWSDTNPAPPITRALNGPYLVMPGHMTVKPCLEYCSKVRNKFHPDKRGYRYAGLEFARECWCGDTLSNHSFPLADSACDMPCDGANKTACGGHLALTLYGKLRQPGGGKDGDGLGDGPDDDVLDPPEDAAALQTVHVGILMLAVTFAFTWGLL
ncbi:WSC domain-containing protein [Hypoxylon sp. FL0890]|nr:WSC domain-containing protein [Hypoxylon sp. FL0890]